MLVWLQQGATPAQGGQGARLAGQSWRGGLGSPCWRVVRRPLPCAGCVLDLCILWIHEI